jgi:hypothetical protein
MTFSVPNVHIILLSKVSVVCIGALPWPSGWHCHRKCCRNLRQTFVVRCGLFRRRNYVMSNVMHKFLINLSIYFCLTCFGHSFSPSSEAGVHLRQWFKSAGYGVSARALIPYPADLYIKLFIIQFHSKVHGPYNIKFGTGNLHLMMSKILWNSFKSGAVKGLTAVTCAV